MKAGPTKLSRVACTKSFSPGTQLLINAPLAACRVLYLALMRKQNYSNMTKSHQCTIWTLRLQTKAWQQTASSWIQLLTLYCIQNFRSSTFEYAPNICTFVRSCILLQSMYEFVIEYSVWPYQNANYLCITCNLTPLVGWGMQVESTGNWTVKELELL